MKKLRLIFTHNPQDYFNGIEPRELSRTYDAMLFTSVSSIVRELNAGYQVIVSKVVDSDEE